MSRNTCTTKIPLNKLQDFVVGEQSMRDFSCAFNEGHNENNAENEKKKHFLQQN